MALLDQGFPPYQLMRSPRESMPWLWCEPTIYQRLIHDMTLEDLNTGVIESFGKGAVAWFVFLESTVYSSADPATTKEVMLDQVVRLRHKGIDVSVERVESFLYDLRPLAYGGARYVLPVLQEVVDVELRRREMEALNAIADQRMADAPAPAQARARRRL